MNLPRPSCWSQSCAEARNSLGPNFAAGSCAVNVAKECERSALHARHGQPSVRKHVMRVVTFSSDLTSGYTRCQQISETFAVDKNKWEFWTPPAIHGAMLNALVGGCLHSLLTAGSNDGPGRPATTSDLAQIIDTMRKRGCSWATIADYLQEDYPGRITSTEQVRGIWRRHFGK